MQAINHSDTSPMWSSSAKVAVVRVFMRETRMECLRLLRTPAFSVPTIIFPVMFYVLFGILLDRAHGDPATAKNILAVFIVFGSLAPGLFGVGATLAVERDRGLLQLKRALPMPAGAYLGAKVAMAMVFAGIVSVLLLMIGLTVARVALDIPQCLALVGVAVFGVLPFCGMGLLLGTLIKSSAAPAVLNLVYLPMSFLSGLLIPISTLPHGLAQLAPIWPSHHLAQLALYSVGVTNRSGIALHLFVPAVLGVLFFLAARNRLRNVR